MAAVDLLDDASAGLPHTRRAMFGGHGFFAPNGGIYAAVVDEDTLVVKLVDATSQAEMTALGGHPWTYAGKMTMREWFVVPETFYDEPTTLRAWVSRAHAHAPPPKPRKGRTRPRPT